MNINLINKYIDAYKSNFVRIHTQEIYKWQAVKVFQDNFDLNASNFHEMLSVSLSKTRNLMSSGNYYPRRMIQKYSEKYPNQLKLLFESLFDQEIDRIERISKFSLDIENLHQEFFSAEFNNSYQDLRAIIVYLNLKYPEDNYFYKYRMLESLVYRIEYDYKVKPGSTANVVQFYSICDLLKEFLVKDNDLIRLHYERLGVDEYHDINLNILTQDFIYAITTHLDILAVNGQLSNTLVKNEFNVQVRNKQVFFRGRQVDFQRKARENKRVGDLGELLVLELEKKSIPINKRHLIQHHSKTIGDGLGYDIQSIDADGDTKFIEVKTTKGPLVTPFFISEHELLRSINEGEKYFLYRVYNYNEQTNSGEFQVFKGDLFKYCNNPINYEVLLKTGGGGTS